MSDGNDAFWRRRDAYWSKVNAQHGNCRPPECDPVRHSQYSINEFAFRLQADQLTAEVEQALSTGEMPRRPRPEPGE